MIGGSSLTFFKGLRSFLWGRKKEDNSVEQVRSGLIEPQNIQSEIRLLTIESGILRTALRLIEKAGEIKILDEKEKEGLISKYLPMLERIYQDRSKKQGLLELIKLEDTKKGLERTYADQITSIEERIREIEQSLISVPLEAPFSLEKDRNREDVSNNLMDEDGAIGRETPLSELKDEVKRAMQRLEQIEVEA